MRKFSPLLIATLVGLSLNGCSEPYPASTSGQGQLTQMTSTAASGIRLYTEPPIKGETSPELRDIVDKIRDYVWMYPDVFSGGYISSDSSQLMVGVSQPEHPAASGFEELANKLDPGRHACSQSPRNGPGLNSTS